MKFRLFLSLSIILVWVYPFLKGNEQAHSTQIQIHTCSSRTYHENIRSSSLCSQLWKPTALEISGHPRQSKTGSPL